jgi:hypothetical protein
MAELNNLKHWVWSVIDYQWDIGFEELCKYVEKNGHSRPPAKFLADSGYSLGSWTSGQRLKKDKLTLDQISKLELLPGWTWDPHEDSWNSTYKDYLEYLHLESLGELVPVTRRLSSWARSQRLKKETLSEDKINKLNALPMWSWDPHNEQWETGFQKLVEYVNKFGSAKVPSNLKLDDGFALGGWITAQRSKRDALDQDRVNKLESLQGWVWNSIDAQWEEGYDNLCKYAANHKDLLIPAKYVNDEGYKLGQWVVVQRTKREFLSETKVKRLEALEGWVWDVLEAQWIVGYNHLREYVSKFGTCEISPNYVCDDGYKLGAWVKKQKYRKNILSSRLDRLLEIKGWS